MSEFMQTDIDYQSIADIVENGDMTSEEIQDMLDDLGSYPSE